jgi:uncharacterized protein (TIGR02145 family)
MKILLYLTLLLLFSTSFSQTKKEQIEILTNRVDSLNRVVGEERNVNKQKSDNILELKETIGNLESQLSKLKESVKLLNEDVNEKENSLTSKAFEISVLETQLKESIDSLSLLRGELEKQKPDPKPVVTNNNSGKVTQTGSFKSVKIGTQTWMSVNLNVATFRNGDPIPEVKTNEEWEKAGKEGKPAWCYYNNDPKNGAKYGKLYNWYAVNDSRGLAPTGWHIPDNYELEILQNYLGSDAHIKMKSTSGWNGIGCKKCNGGSTEFKKICSACKGTQRNSIEPFSGNGTNSSGFSGLPGGFRSDYGGSFHEIGDNSYWLSSTEYNADTAWILDLGRSHFRDYRDKGNGFSVRCLRD